MNNHLLSRIVHERDDNRPGIRIEDHFFDDFRQQNCLGSHVEFTRGTADLLQWSICRRLVLFLALFKHRANEVFNLKDSKAVSGMDALRPVD